MSLLLLAAISALTATADLPQTDHSDHAPPTPTAAQGVAAEKPAMPMKCMMMQEHDKPADDHAPAAGTKSAGAAAMSMEMCPHMKGEAAQAKAARDAPHKHPAKP